MAKVVKYVEPLVLSVMAIFAPISSLLISTGAMIVLDLITGVMAAQKRGEPISSARLRDSLSKLFIYEIALCAAFVAEHYISDILPFVKMASAMVAMVEIKSVYENLNSISGKNLLKIAIDKLGSANKEKSEE